ncbi:MAG: mannose-6-phosphate isomerase, partial [bacterium]
DQYNISSNIEIATNGKTFHIINCVSGKAKITWKNGVDDIYFGETILVPASIDTFTITADSDDCVIVDSYVS